MRCRRAAALSWLRGRTEEASPSDKEVERHGAVGALFELTPSLLLLLSQLPALVKDPTPWLDLSLRRVVRKAAAARR